MKAIILSGSLRENSNTEILAESVINHLEKYDYEVDIIKIKEKHIEPCTACWTCQDIFESHGCPKKDDMHEIYNSVLEADVILFASPIYSWYCTPPLKAVMDRLVYGMNKYYGKKRGPSLWADKVCGLVTTCGYEIEAGAGVLSEGLKRYCEHSGLKYIGMCAERDIAGKEHFRRDEAIEHTRCFFERIVEAKGV